MSCIMILTPLELFMKVLLKRCFVKNLRFFSSTYTAFRMVETELEEVLDISPEMSDIINRNSKRLTVYYGEGDAWTPSHFYEDFVDKFPEVDTIFGRDGFKHDFVLDSSHGVAELCHKFLPSL